MSGNGSLDVSGESGFAKRLESYRPWCRVFVRKALYGQIGKRIDESDVIQSTWLDILRNFEQFRGTTENEFFAWLKTCLENNVKNVLRDNMAGKRDFRREQEFSITDDSATLLWIDPVAADGTASDHAVEGENALALSAALESLPENQRRAIELRHLQGLKLSEVAEQMEKTADAVVGLMRRGMHRLNETLNDR